ncbi:MAG TPA: DinB family protein [Terriglobales bacterium]|jgi:uncharacterized damage-inducible protein DinB
MPDFVVSAAALQEHLAYTVWASTRLLAAAGELSDRELVYDFKTADHSVVGTLAHIFAADRVWLGRIKQRPPHVFISEKDKNLAVLQEQWPGLHAAWMQWAADLTDQSAHSVLAYQDLKGNPWTQPTWQVVLHVVNHATHHRGQVSGFLRALGHTPPSLDLIAYYREKLR